jgi:hypothetical protein
LPVPKACGPVMGEHQRERRGEAGTILGKAAYPAGWGYDGFRRLGLRPSHPANRKTQEKCSTSPVQPLTSHSSSVATPRRSRHCCFSGTAPTGPTGDPRCSRRRAAPPTAAQRPTSRGWRGLGDELLEFTGLGAAGPRCGTSRISALPKPGRWQRPGSGPRRPRVERTSSCTSRSVSSRIRRVRSARSSTAPGAGAGQPAASPRRGSPARIRSTSTPE